MLVSKKCGLVGLFLALGASAAVANDGMQVGQKLYEENCGTCHQMDGSGVMFMQPELIANERANSPIGGIIDMILLGSAAIEEGTSDFSNEMPSFDRLTNEEIAQIATYVRTNFENSGGSVNVDDVQSRRKK